MCLSSSFRLPQPNLDSYRILTGAIACSIATSISWQGRAESWPEEKKFGHSFVDSISRAPLPFTGQDSDFSIDIKPKLGDVVHERYIRLPMELEYSFTNKREGKIGLTPYFSNPFDSDPVSSDGYLTFGLKQRLDDMLDGRLFLAGGFNARIPLEEIPSPLLRSSYDQYMPYITAAYRLDEEARWLAYSTVQYQWVGSDRRDNKLPVEAPNSLAVFQPGIIYQPLGEFRYGLSLEYKTDRFDGGSDDGLKIIPSITWFPPEDTPYFRRLVGHFELSLDLEYALSEIEEEEYGSDFGVGLRVRWRFLKSKPHPEESVL
ncbi:hypothetical protein IEN85_19540 [Pelagicoccus sp. NFK12]|uniref:Uncharacterized protein n=1 Tax=Pelagicoccus enzymogenes TaxID=2773457 RepID=A0A927FAV8_9BACT|nr:hypothetical protein [Pelagicoccus enzymogenes]MBD5781703.1 hypothetical protein [Pelagicoccus enzymogenes]MDQ8200017.1 hypothetical protein [Pelagicoccus enzymogenes]